MTTDWNLSKTGFTAMDASIQLKLKEREHNVAFYNNIAPEIKLSALHNIPATSLAYFKVTL